MKYYFFRAFPAFTHKNYRIWVAGQFTSLIGTWMQMVAQGWLVLDLTNSALWVGIIAALNALPVLFFSLFGGFIVDKFPKKRVLFVAECSAMVLALVLGILTITGVVTVLHIAVLAFLLGVVNAIDMPARLSFTNEMVEKESLSSALALNAGMFNGARVVGPMIAGYVIVSIGIGLAFVANSLSFLAVLVALFFIKEKRFVPNTHPHPITAIRAGISYSLSHTVIKNLLIFAGLLGVFGWSYIVIMPVVVREIFNGDAALLGFLNAIAGIGSLAAAMIVSATSNKVNPWKIILSGGAILGISLILLGLTASIYVGSVAMFGIGLGLLLQFATINATIQHNVDNNFRGRVMSIYAFMFQGMTPFGSMQVGFLAEKFGAPIAMQVSGLIVLLLCLYFFKRVKVTSLQS